MAYFWVGGTGTWDALAVTNWSSSSGGLPNQVVPPTSSDAVTFDGSSGGGTVTVNTNFSVASITMGAFTGTLDFSANNNSPTMGTFSCSGTGTRTLNMGSGTWSISGNNATIWNTTTATGLTLNANTSTINCTYSGSTGTRTFSPGSVVTLNNILISSGTDIFTFAVILLNSLDFTGFKGTSTPSSNINMSGSFTLDPGMIWTSNSNTLVFNGTTSATINTHGVQINQSIQFNGSGGSWTLQNSLDIGGVSSRTITLVTGTFNANNFNVTCGIFSSSNSNTRVLTQGTGLWSITGNNTTVWSVLTVTGLTFNKGTQPIQFTYSSSTGTRTISQGSLAGAGTLTAHPDFSITAGTDVIGFTGSRCGHLNFTGFSGTLNSGVKVIYGNLILSATMTWSGGTSITTFSSDAVTQTFTTAGRNTNSPFTINCTGTGTVLLNGNLDMSGTAREILHSSGGFNANNFNISCGDFNSSNSTARTITMGSGTWTLTGTGTVWTTATTTGLTLNQNTSLIKINDASASSKTIASGVTTLNNLQLTGGGTGVMIIGTTTGTSTFNNIRVDNPLTVQVFAGKTVVASSLTWSGSEGSINTFQSTTNGTAWTISVPSGTISEDYISLRDSTAAGSIPFYAGIHSTNVSGNTNWVFTDALPISQVAPKDANGSATRLLTSDVNGKNTLQMYIDPNSHGILYDNTGTGSDFGITVAPKDANGVAVLMGVSSSDGTTPVSIYGNSDDNSMFISSI